MNKILIATTTLATSSSVAFAHPGDHAFSVLNSLVHVLTETDHLVMIATGIVVVGVLFYKRSRRTV